MAKQLPYHDHGGDLPPLSARRRPSPKGELEHVNAYTLVVAVALSAQATDAGVNKATRALFQVADTPQKMLDLGEEA
jgi:endonuclease-3